MICELQPTLMAMAKARKLLPIPFLVILLRSFQSMLYQNDARKLMPFLCPEKPRVNASHITQNTATTLKLFFAKETNGPYTLQLSVLVLYLQFRDIVSIRENYIHLRLCALLSLYFLW